METDSLGHLLSIGLRFRLRRSGITGILQTRRLIHTSGRANHHLASKDGPVRDFEGGDEGSFVRRGDPSEGDDIVGVLVREAMEKKVSADHTHHEANRKKR